jgi:hypothetical protein
MAVKRWEKIRERGEQRRAVRREGSRKSREENGSGGRNGVERGERVRINDIGRAVTIN